MSKFADAIRTGRESAAASIPLEQEQKRLEAQTQNAQLAADEQWFTGSLAPMLDQIASAVATEGAGFTYTVARSGYAIAVTVTFSGKSQTKQSMRVDIAGGTVSVQAKNSDGTGYTGAMGRTEQANTLANLEEQFVNDLHGWASRDAHFAASGN